MKIFGYVVVIDVYECSSFAHTLQLHSEQLPRNPLLTDIHIKCNFPLDDGILLAGSSSRFGYIVLFRNMKIVQEIIEHVSLLASDRVLCSSTQEVVI